MKLWHRNIATPRASPLRVVTDLVFAITLLLVMLVLALLVGLLGVMYWTKMDLGIDLFNNHLFDFFELSRHEVNFV
jgi:hypothetical protein